MSVVRSFFSALLMYSKIPVPKQEWNEENRRYSLCFFPTIGLAVGGLTLVWYLICTVLDFGKLMFSVVCTIIPIAVTGGIHLDGFCDVCDAGASWGGKDKMLGVMKDPHIGAFAAIKLCVYFLLQTAFFSEAYDKKLLLIYSCGTVLSRSMSALAAVVFKAAKKEGSLNSFANSADRRITIFSEAVLIVLSTGGMMIVKPICGIAAAAGAFAVFAYYRVYSYRRFGGITGDLAGWFLQLCELAVLMCAVVADKIS